MDRIISWGKNKTQRGQTEKENVSIALYLAEGREDLNKDGDITSLIFVLIFKKLSQIKHLGWGM